MSWRAVDVNPRLNKIIDERNLHIHLHNLKSLKPVVETKCELSPRAYRGDPKLAEIRSCIAKGILQDNRILKANIQKIKTQHRQEPAYKIRSPRKSLIFKEKEEKIVKDNQILAKNILTNPPILNRFDWVLHSVQHKYQYNRLARNKATVRLSEVLETELQTLSPRRRAKQNSLQESFDTFATPSIIDNFRIPAEELDTKL